jgi:hypothetical protein
MGQRGISKPELRRARKYGEHERTEDGRMLIRHNATTLVMDRSQKVGVTCFPTSAEDRTIYAAVKQQLIDASRVAAQSGKLKSQEPEGAASASLHTKGPTLNPVAVSRLTSMGFSQSQAEYALVSSEGNVPRAIEVLVSEAFGDGGDYKDQPGGGVEWDVPAVSKKKSSRQARRREHLHATHEAQSTTAPLVAEASEEQERSGARGAAQNQDNPREHSEKGGGGGGKKKGKRR